MKKYVIYIVVLAVGLLLGRLLFGESSNRNEAHNHSEMASKNQMWTCSMHPQILQPTSGNCPICGMDLIPAKAGADGLAANQFRMTKNAMALAGVKTTTIGGNAVSGLNAKLSGVVVADQDKIATMPAHYNGRIEKLYIKSLGQKVTKGQAVAQVYSPELVTAQQELLMAYRLKDTQPNLYRAIRNKFLNWKISEAQISSIEASGKTRSNFTVYSHVTGVVTEILATEGSHIMEGKPIFKVADLASVWANFDVYENQIAQFKKGQEILITTKSYLNKVFLAKVDFIDPILDTQKRTVTLRAVLKNKDGLFKPGMFVKGAVKGVVSKTGKAIQVPSSAVLWTGERSVVYVKANPDKPVFEMRNVVLGNSVGDTYKILDGLSIGETIVTNGTFTVDAAAQLQGKKSMMNKDGGKTTTGHEHHAKTGNTAESNFDKLFAGQRLDVTEAFRQQLKKVYESYTDIKDALVADNIKKTKEGVGNLLDDLNKINTKLLKDEPYNHWMPLEKDIKASAVAISKVTDLKEQRDHFKHLSLRLINAIRLFGINEKVYVEFCPMADGNNGAYWLSDKEKVINPYFGDAMLTCGEVKQVIE